MRFTSLVIELIRSRPGLVVCVVLLVQAAIWLILPSLLFIAPPGNVAEVLAYGREYQVGSDLGPPLAFWIADLAFRAAGNHVAGVYLAAQLSFVATFALLYRIGRATVGGPHAVLAVLLTMTIVAFGWPGIDFGPRVLAQPFWAWALLATWQIVGQRRRSGWFALSLACGLLILITRDGWWLLMMLVVFLAASPRGRRQLASFDPLYALLVIAALALPWLIWTSRSGGLRLPALGGSDFSSLQMTASNAGWLLALLIASGAGIAVLVAMNSKIYARVRHRQPFGPTISRAGVDPLAKRFVYGFAIATPFLSVIFGALRNPPELAGGPGIAMLMVGLAAIVASGDVIELLRQRMLRRVWAFAVALPALVAVVSVTIVPWLGRAGPSPTLPAAMMASFFAESFERRTGRPLPAVAGETGVASLVAMGPTRPRLFRASPAEQAPWMTTARFAETGGVVVWRATDTAGLPPPEIAERFPGLVPEVPRSFEHLLNGRQTPPRIGWAIVRPKAS